MAGRLKNRRDKSTELHAITRELKRVLFHEGQYKPKVIKNKKRDKLNKGFKDEY